MLKEEALHTDTCTRTHTDSASHTFFLSPLTDRQIDRRRLSCFIFLFSNSCAVDSTAENSLQSVQAGTIPMVAEANEKILYFPNGAHSLSLLFPFLLSLFQILVIPDQQVL